MGNVTKQVVGIDVSKSELVVSFSRMLGDGSIEHLSNRTFSNNIKGFEALLKVSEKIFSKEEKIIFTDTRIGDDVKNAQELAELLYKVKQAENTFQENHTLHD